MRRNRVTQSQGSSGLVNKFSRIQDPMRIERMFELAMQLAHDVSRRVRPPAFLRQADSVLACDHSAPRQHLRKKIVERLFHFVAHGRDTIIPIRHDIDMNITVASMTKGSDRKSMFCMQLPCEFD